MLHYLIVGGCGQVGFHLARRLLHNSHKVTVLDSVEEPHSARNRRDLTWGLCNHIRVDCAELSYAPKPWEVDRVFWLANAPLRYDNVGIQHRGVGALLRWAQQPWTRGRYKFPRVVVVTPPYVHEAADAAVEHYAHRKLTVRQVRMFDVYGPRMPEHAVVQAMFDTLMAGEELILRDDGRQERALMHVEDAALALYNVMNPADMQPTVSIAGTERWRMRDLAASIRRRTGSRGHIRIVTDRSGDRLRHYPVFNAFKSEPTYSFESSFHDLLRWAQFDEDPLESHYSPD